MIIGLFFFEEPYSLIWYILASGVFAILFSFKLEKVFRILDYNPLKLIGVMSYSIYLLHGILLWITFQAINKILPISNMNFEYYWLIISFLVIPLMIFSSLTFKHIENRFHHY
jgi:peptidoglycan/LPS O-acetylase OafA/YrhL